MLNVNINVTAQPSRVLYVLESGYPFIHARVENLDVIGSCQAKHYLQIRMKKELSLLPAAGGSESLVDKNCP